MHMFSASSSVIGRSNTFPLIISVIRSLPCLPRRDRMTGPIYSLNCRSTSGWVIEPSGRVNWSERYLSLGRSSSGRSTTRMKMRTGNCSANSVVKLHRPLDLKPSINATVSSLTSSLIRPIDLAPRFSFRIRRNSI